MRTLFLALLLSLTACAGNDVLPQIGNGLQKAVTAVDTIAQVRQDLETVYSLTVALENTAGPLCATADAPVECAAIKPLLETKPSVKIRAVLDAAAVGVLDAQTALTLAVKVYTDVNDAVKAAQ